MGRLFFIYKRRDIFKSDNESEMGASLVPAAAVIPAD